MRHSLYDMIVRHRVFNMQEWRLRQRRLCRSRNLVVIQRGMVFDVFLVSSSFIVSTIWALLCVQRRSTIGNWRPYALRPYVLMNYRLTIDGKNPKWRPNFYSISYAEENCSHLQLIFKAQPYHFCIVHTSSDPLMPSVQPILSPPLHEVLLIKERDLPGLFVNSKI